MLISIMPSALQSAMTLDGQKKSVFSDVNTGDWFYSYVTKLAAAGVVMQGLFRNSMADPYLLGTSSGGALGAALAIVCLGGAFHGLFAFIGVPAHSKSEVCP